MDYIRRASERGHADFGWLQSAHTFSFGQYYDPEHMGVSVLRVINDDKVAPGAGFDTHPHRDMEIISYITEGTIEHIDTMGNKKQITAGEVQRMTAGTGVAHSEYNASKTDPLAFLQIWVLPNKRGLEPDYEQKQFEQTETLTALVTPNGDKGSIRVNQDMSIHRLELKDGESFDLTTNDRVGYLHIVRGAATINGEAFESGDGMGSLPDRTLNVTGKGDDFEALWFDLPPVQH